MVLACALRKFAGASSYDLATTFGVSVTVINYSMNWVIDAVNRCKQLQIRFPEEHAEQKKIAEEFKNKSTADISNCVGALDGLLIWIEKPSEKECTRVGVGSKKFYCGRKAKFGLNLQALCDARRKFTFVSLQFPGSTSDFLTWECTGFKEKVATEGFLAPGLCIFGDCAYTNTKYLATPFVSATDVKDDYNFYHSQLRINIECAFGMLVHRWAILRSALSSKYSMKKIKELVRCLRSLHNFLIDCNFTEVQSTYYGDVLNLLLKNHS